MKKQKTHSKRYLELEKLIDKNKVYSIEEAIELAKKTSSVKFDATIEAHFRLGINASKSDQLVRGVVIMPHSIGKSKIVAAIVSPEKAEEAKNAGADIVGGVEMIDAIKQTQKINFDVLISTPDMMKILAPLAKILGPKGLMPSPKSETITTNITKTVKELKAGKITFKNDDTGNIHTIVGKVSLDSKALVANFTAIKEAVEKAKPAASKGIYVKNISISSAMGPGIKVS